MCDLFTFLLISFFCIYVGMLFAYQTTAIITTAAAAGSLFHMLEVGLCVSLSQLFSSCQLLYTFHYTYIFIIILHHHGVDLGLVFYAIGFFLLYILYSYIYVCFYLRVIALEKAADCRDYGLYGWGRRLFTVFIILSRAQAMAANMIIDYRVFVI